MIGRNVRCKVSKNGKTETALVRWKHAIVGNTTSIKIDDFDKFGYCGFKVDSGWLIEEINVASVVTTVLRAA